MGNHVAVLHEITQYEGKTWWLAQKNNFDNNCALVDISGSLAWQIRTGKRFETEDTEIERCTAGGSHKFVINGV